MGTIVIATLGTQRAYADWDSYWSRVKEELSDSFFPDPPPSIYEEITEALTEMVECTHPEWEKEPEVQTQYYIYGTKTCKACGLQTPYSDPLPGVA